MAASGGSDWSPFISASKSDGLIQPAAGMVTVIVGTASIHRNGPSGSSPSIEGAGLAEGAGVAEGAVA